MGSRCSPVKGEEGWKYVLNTSEETGQLQAGSVCTLVENRTWGVTSWFACWRLLYGKDTGSTVQSWALPVESWKVVM